MQIAVFLASWMHCSEREALLVCVRECTSLVLENALEQQNKITKIARCLFYFWWRYSVSQSLCPFQRSAHFFRCHKSKRDLSFPFTFSLLSSLSLFSILLFSHLHSSPPSLSLPPLLPSLLSCHLP